MRTGTSIAEEARKSSKLFTAQYPSSFHLESQTNLWTCEIKPGSEPPLSQVPQTQPQRRRKGLGGVQELGHRRRLAAAQRVR
ncbi:Protein of unknown function D [Prunus dulcis]|uniref:Uncharacterized protein n=1 Tax=Prunus dulcis TaxID=3755 RepID=A0A4Y1QZU7_PRUDU|nr:Protein of unknown function D [Prunus dulcis]